MAAGLVTLGIATWVGYSHVKAESAAFERQQQIVWTHGRMCESTASNFDDYSMTAEKLGQVSVVDSSRTESRSALLEKGMSFPRIVNLLGKPSFAEARVSKDRGEYWGCAWSYVIKAHVEDKNLVLDRTLNLLFDGNDALKEWQEIDRFGEEVHK